MNFKTFLKKFPGSKIRFANDFRYRNYPKGVNLHPDSETHQKLLAFLLELVNQSYNVISVRHDSWAEIDHKLNVYIDLSSDEEDDQEDDPRRPVSIVVPLSYATRETLLSYRMSAFMADPVFRYDWLDPNDALGVIMLQKIIATQVNRKKMGLDLMTMWSDDITYGFGTLVDEWTVERRKIRKKLQANGQLLDYDEYMTTYEGNALYSFDPYNTYPDPTVPIHRVEQMQFFAGIERTNYYDLLSFEKEDPTLFNVRYLLEKNVGKSVYYMAIPGITGRYDKSSINPNFYAGSADSMIKTVDVIWIYAKIIPKDFKLSSETYPEIWKFGVAGDRIIIAAKRLENNHGRIPVAAIASNSDDHTTIPMSILEIEFPLQHAVDWLWSAHVINVRKHLNNMLVVDPSLINMNDLVNTKYGMIARLRAKAFGRGVNDAVKQLQLTDVTKGNIQDIGFLMDIDQRVTAASTQMQGILARRSERISATEARDTRLSGLSRLAKNARVIALQGMHDLAYMLASNTIQFQTEDVYIKTAGDYEDVLREEYGVYEEGLRVSPDALDVNFDVIVHDGSIPGGEYADVWQRLLQVSQMSPELYQRIDFTRAWLHIARLLGAKDPSLFLKKAQPPKVLPDQQVEQGVKAGNLVTPEEMQK